MIMLNEYIRIK